MLSGQVTNTYLLTEREGEYYNVIEVGRANNGPGYLQFKFVYLELLCDVMYVCIYTCL